MKIDARTSNTTTVESRHDRVRSRLASRRAGDRAHRDKERGRNGGDPIVGVFVASAASHIRGWYARISQQNSRGKAVHVVWAICA